MSNIEKIKLLQYEKEKLGEELLCKFSIILILYDYKHCNF